MLGLSKVESEALTIHAHHLSSVGATSFSRSIARYRYAGTEVYLCHLIKGKTSPRLSWKAEIAWSMNGSARNPHTVEGASPKMVIPMLPRDVFQTHSKSIEGLRDDETSRDT